jgi:hypothetical protein
MLAYYSADVLLPLPKILNVPGHSTKNNQVTQFMERGCEWKIEINQ